MQADDRSCDVFFLTEGRAQVVIYTHDGETVPFRDIGPGGMFGEFAAIDNKRRSASVEVLEPCLVACIAADNFRNLLKNDSAVMMALLKHAIAQVRVLTDRVFEYSTLDVPERILSYLVRKAREDGVVCGKEVHLGALPRQQDIADLLNMNREAVPREVSALKDEKIVEWRGDVFVILDLDRLIHRLGNYPHKRAAGRR